MFASAWNRLWDMHDQVKGLFRFFFQPNTSEMATGGGGGQKIGVGNAGGGQDPRSFSTAQFIGLILGPLLFILTLLFFKPEGLSVEGVAILASTLWIATW